MSNLLIEDAEVTDISVCAAASVPLVVVIAVCSYAFAVAQIETPTELPHVPADLAAHSPTEP